MRKMQMSQDEMITQCPSCQTSFKVTDAQLHAADGAVRCGSCLQVFKGAEHISQEIQKTEIGSDALVEDDSKEPVEEDLVASVDDGLEKRDEDDTEEFVEETLEESVDDDLETLDEGDAEAAVGDDTEALDRDALDDSDDSDSDEPDEVVLEDLVEGLPTNDSEVTDEENVEEVVEDSKEEKSEELVAKALDEGGSEPLVESTPADLVEEFDLDNELRGAAGNINLLENEAIDIVGDYQPMVQQAKAKWAVFGFLLICCFVLQFSWFNKSILAQQTNLRPYYQNICNLFGCTIPEYSDLRLMSISDLLIRTHPITDRALKVDAILRNDAHFRQRFPPLRLQFTDLNDNTIATRVFLPREYLKGELTGLKFIPASTEVRLALEIVDPDAVGYSLMIIPPR